MRILLSIVGLLIVCAAPFAHADKVSQYKPPTQFEDTDDFYVIEGAGLFQSGSAKAFNVKMWDNSARADITDMLKSLPVNSQSHVAQDLIDAILLSESNTEELKNYKNITPGEDLLTLRIYKLIEGGFFKDALELYSVALDTPHHEAIAKAGIITMLGSGEKSIACLEMKTLGRIESEDDFWAVFTAYCDYTLSDEPSEQAQSVLEETRFEILRSLAFNDSFIFPYAPDDWAGLHILEQSVLMAEGRIEVPVLNDAYLNDLPPRDLTMLLSLETLSDKDRLSLLLLARKWGLVEDSDLAEAYEDVKSRDVLGGLPMLYQKLLNEPNAEARVPLLTQALDLYEQHGVYALLPFADDFAQSSLDGLSDTKMRALLNVFYHADTINADGVIENYSANAEENLENSAFLENVKAISLVFRLPASHQFVTNMQNIGIFHKNTQELIEFDIEQLDKEVSDVDNAVKVYEKDVDAAVQKRQEDLLKQLQSASRDNALGETVLLSITLLSGKTPHHVDEDVYSDVLKALEKAELKEFSRKMAIERLIGEEQGRS